LPAFPALERRYESSDLFPLFQNRVLNSSRKDFSEYLESLALSEPDPIEMLALTGGDRQTDNLEVFPRLTKDADGTVRCRFFVHGLRYISEAAKQRGLQLSSNERLGVSIELTNPATTVAIQLTTADYHFVGWTPHYLVPDLMQVISEGPANVSAQVVRVNRNDVPANRRVLVEFCGRFPTNVEPMSGDQFQPIVGGKEH
jgi:hypothetical protein